eukprot:15470848-Alexandrium_andersonii.AAC.1
MRFLPGILFCQEPRNAMRNPLKARQCFNPPQSALRSKEHATSHSALGASTAWAQEQPQTRPLLLPM